MVQILAIAPYEGLANVFESVKNKYPDVSLTIHTSDLGDALKFVQNKDGSIYDVIISRGGTAQLLKQFIDIPIIEINISIYDMLRVIQLASGYDQQFAIVGFSFITSCARALLSLYPNQRAIIQEIHSEEEADERLMELKASGCSLVIGDTVISRKSKLYGLNSILITSGQESVDAAIETARELFRVIRRQNLSMGILGKLWELGGQYGLVLDRDGNTVYRNLPDALYQLVSKKLLPSEKMDEDSKQRAVTVIHDQKQYAFSVSSLIIQDQQYTFFCAQAPIQLPPKNDQFVQCYDKEKNQSAAFNILNAQSDAGKKLLSSIQNMAQQRLPVLVVGEPGLEKRSIVDSIHSESPLADNPLFIIDAKRGTPQKWKALMDSFNSPLYRENYGICFRNIQEIDSETWDVLLQCILGAKIHKRNRLYFTYTTGSDEPAGQGTLQWETVVDKLDCLMLTLPPLRSRTEDIVPISTLYVSEMNEKLGKQVVGFEEEALHLLQQFDWQMNFEQLRQVIREAVALTDDYIISAKTVKGILKQDQVPSQAASGSNLLEDVIKEHIFSVLKKENGNQTRAAQILGISRGTLWRRLSEYENS